MKGYALVTSVLTLAIVGTAGAQARPTATITRPVMAPSVAKTTRPTSATPTTLNSGTVSGIPISTMAAGRYELGLHAQKRNGQPMNVVTVDDTVFVARSGSSMTISADSLSLTGSVSGAHFTAEGTQSGGPALSLAGTANATGAAAGTFSLQRGTSSITGTFTMSPVPVTAQAHDVVTRPAGGHGGGTTSCNLWCKLKNLLGL
jgi:hypothetical protein